MASIDDQRAELKHALDRAEAWLHELQGLSAVSFGLPSPEDDAETIVRLRSRAASVLINIAMFGGASSGKSFLASGLQAGLEFLRLPSNDGTLSDKYVGLLPFAPTPTNMCPARVVPGGDGVSPDAGGRGFVRVRFVDSNETAWEDIGDSPPPAVIAAYMMLNAETAHRKPEHMHRTVAEVEIALADARLPAKLYDLPGYGSADPNHERVATCAVADADCFIYVANATRALTANAKDLKMINFLHGHYLTSRKRVVWVLTAIDKAMDLGIDDEPAWKATLAANNEYLFENFTLSDGRPDAGFIGPGFIPVSPALEAQGRYYAARDVKERGNTLQAASKMADLRQALIALIDEGAGRRHLSAVAVEAFSIIVSRQRAIAGRLDAERLPFDRLVAERAAVETRLGGLDRSADEMKSHLYDILDLRIRIASQNFDGLARHLHEKLDGKIRSADFYDDVQANRIEIEKVNILSEWMGAPDGPATRWGAEFESFRHAALFYVLGRLGEDGLESALSAPPPLEIERLTIPRTVRRQTAATDVVERTALFVTAAAPISAGAAYVLTAVVASTIAFPVVAAAATAAGAIAVAVTASHRNRRSSLGVRRRERIEDLDREADEYRKSFIAAVRAQGQLVIDNVLGYLDDYRSQLGRTLQDIIRRIADPATLDRVDLIRQLEPLDRDANEILLLLQRLRSANPPG